MIRVNDFSIEYREDGSEKQFFSDLSVLDVNTGEQLTRKTISVNKPLRWGGVTLYQTDWSLAALSLRAEGSPMQPADGSSFNLPMASLEGNPGQSRQVCKASAHTIVGGASVCAGKAQVRRCMLPSLSLPCVAGISGRVWGTFLPSETPAADGAAPRGVSILARDLQSVAFYDGTGAFVGVRRPDSGKPIEVRACTAAMLL